MKKVEPGRVGELICTLRLCQLDIEAEILHLGTTDILAFAHDRVWRIQVKSSIIRKCNDRKAGYQFGICTGQRVKKPLKEEDCDIIALVAIPQERVIFKPVSYFNAVLTKRMSPFEYMGPNVEIDSWCETVKSLGATPPLPSYFQALGRPYSVL